MRAKRGMVAHHTDAYSVSWRDSVSRTIAVTSRYPSRIAESSMMKLLSFNRSREQYDITPLYELGKYLEDRKDMVGAAMAYREAVRRDPSGLPIDHQLIDSIAQRFMFRRAMVRFVERHLKEIRRRALATPEAELVDPKVYVYWEQGFDQAPPIVRTCRARLRDLCGSNLVELDRDSLVDVVDVPYAVRSFATKKRAAYSDFVRIALLRKHGGVWIDATCLATQDPIDQLERLLASGFFAFRYQDARISSWLLASKPGGYITSMMYEGLHEYWHRRDIDVSYFFFHHMFEAFYYLDPKFAAAWDATPNLSSHPPHDLQRAMQEPYDSDRLEQLLFGSFVHKLTYKKEPEPGSILEYLCSEDAASEL
jgi:hypothetical protein